MAFGLALKKTSVQCENKSRGSKANGLGRSAVEAFNDIRIPYVWFVYQHVFTVNKEKIP
jgi:hypothetical protein